MRKLAGLVLGIAMTGLLSLSAHAEITDAGQGTDGAGVEAQIAELLEMAPAERRAYLKSLDPSERNGLWYRVQRAKAEANGHLNERGAYSDSESARSIDPPIRFPGNRAVGTITYDDGLGTVGFGTAAGIIGNRFDTHTGIPVLASGTVSTIQAMVVPGPANTTSSAGFVLLGPQTGGGGAMAIFSTFTNASGVVDTVSFPGIGASYTGSSFFVLFGDFASVYIPVFGPGTVLGQGHHGVVGYTGGMGPNITSTSDLGGSLNSMIRARGNIVPVELMSFNAE